MNQQRRLAIILFFTLVAIGLHIYLAIQHYQVQLGQSMGESLCNINETFSCTAVNASSYSKFLGIPLALWGAITNSIFLFWLLAWLMGWSDDSRRTGRMAIYLGGFIAFASLVMGAISVTQLSVYCPFCIGAYILSFVNFGLLLSLRKETNLEEWTQDIKTFFRRPAVLASILAIPLLSMFFDRIAYDKVGGRDEVDRFVIDSLIEWQSNPMHDFSAEASLVKGVDDPLVTIVEFADFRCGHCRHASPTLAAFVSSHPDTRLIFKTFPLDSECNPELSRGNGLSCRLAYATYCAENQEKGWAMHDLIFQNQGKFTSHHTIDTELKDYASQLELEWSSFDDCMNAPATRKAIQDEAQRGGQAGVQGTPSIFVNGRLLPGGQLLPILEAAYKKAKTTEKE